VALNFKGKYLKLLLGGVLLSIIAVTWFVYPVFTRIAKSDLPQAEFFISTESSFEAVVSSLDSQQCIDSRSDFKRAAWILRYSNNNVRPGRYILHENMTYLDLVRKLRSGNQDAVSVVLNNVRTIEELAGKTEQYFEADSVQLINYFKDTSVCSSLGLKTENILTLFIPNTYEMYWTTTPEKFVSRMKSEYDKYWTEERLSKIRAIGLDQSGAYIMASIVEKETNYNPEKPSIAGVYMNRLKAGMKLQADPTVVFALKKFDLKRVLHGHLTYDSPYNTYKYEGLPPGPICMPSMASLEAVVNMQAHKYMYFCAKPEYSGKHAFAVTYGEHLENARIFSNWLDSQNIK
jgi:UPF0755 protein